MALAQILDFLAFHPLFGPWAIIIGELLLDVGKFVVVSKSNLILRIITAAEYVKNLVGFLILSGSIWFCKGLTSPFLKLLRIINIKLLENYGQNQ